MSQGSLLTEKKKAGKKRGRDGRREGERENEGKEEKVCKKSFSKRQHFVTQIPNSLRKCRFLHFDFPEKRHTYISRINNDKTFLVWGLKI